MQAEAEGDVGQDIQKDEQLESSLNDGKGEANSEITFESLGLCPELCEVVEELGWKKPTPIQEKTLPTAFQGKDIIGLAQTGSGKTGAFVLPILQALLQSGGHRKKLFAVVLAPTRELALQIADQFSALGAHINLRCATVVGGIDAMAQALALAKNPHVVVATPGRLVDHLQNTKGFDLRSIKYLVLDEADQLLNLDFQEAIDTIVRACPPQRCTYLFSATMTNKVSKLQRACLRNPVRIEVSEKYQVVDKLIQQYLFIPFKHKNAYLTYITNELAGQTIMMFVRTCVGVQKLALVLRNLGFPAVPIHGQMSQPARIGAMNQFKSKQAKILIATDVASRGLDIPWVDVVINYDLPSSPKTYMHRVGRTARAGRAGRAISLVTQYDVEVYQHIEQAIGQKLPAYEVDKAAVMSLVPRLIEAERLATQSLKDGESGRTPRAGGTLTSQLLQSAEGGDEDLDMEAVERNADPTEPGSISGAADPFAARALGHNRRKHGGAGSKHGRDKDPQRGSKRPRGGKR